MRFLIVAPVLLILVVGFPRASGSLQTERGRFQLEEATIADVHRAIQAGQLTCRGLVQAYVDARRRTTG